jgi:hypothetical protein
VIVQEIATVSDLRHQILIEPAAAPHVSHDFLPWRFSDAGHRRERGDDEHERGKRNKNALRGQTVVRRAFDSLPDRELLSRQT